jgi:hypothetical protein
MEDKVLVLKFADEKIAFPADVERIIANELPFYLRWLVDWKVPDEIVGNARFGIHSYIDDRLPLKPCRRERHMICSTSSLSGSDVR